MSFALFLKSRAPLIVLFAVVLLFVSLTVYVLTGNMWSIVPVAGALLGGLALALAWRYRRDAKFYKEVDELASQLEHPYQLHALMTRPSCPEHVVVFEALRAMGTSSANEVSAAREQACRHREYVETWVHEVKSPLAAALLACERVPEPEKSLIRGDVNKALREVEQVLWYARAENPNADYLIRKVALASVVRAACRKEARSLIEQGIAVDVSVDESVVVRTDEKQIGFVLSQIITNAAKYGAGRVSFTAFAAQDEFGAQVVTLAISDDGSGIPAADMPRIFDRGFTGARGRAAGSSTGMGLYIASTICRRIGVGLSAASDGRHGTTMSLSFPQDARLELAGRE